nr:MAG: hypothetical protein KatS3mg041_0174 [Bacteroidota bacterium]
MKTEYPFHRYEPLMEDPEAFWACLARPLPACLWVNPYKTDPERLLASLREEGYEPEPLGWYPGAYRLPGVEKPGATLAFVAGWYYVQEEIALTAVVALDPQPGERVLDLCAAPGGKTAQIALRVGLEGTVVANEFHTRRLSSLRATIERLGLPQVVVTHHDGTTLPLQEGTFDRVLVDAPCSGEGTVRKRSSSWKGYRPAFVEAAQQLQRQLLQQALRLVKPGGVVVYSTCTYAPEENEAVLDAVLGDWGYVEPFSIPGLRFRPGIRQWNGRTFREDIAHAHRYWPHLNDTGGFFVARIRRTDLPMPQATARRPEPARYDTARPLEEDSPLRWFTERFGLDRSGLAPFRFWSRGREKIWMTRAQTWLPEGVNLHSAGIALLRRTHYNYKPTTAALQYFGPQIQRNAITLQHRDEARRFVTGQSLVLPGPVTWEPGYVQVRFGPYELGCGLARGTQLHSQIPKGLWVLGSD